MIVKELKINNSDVLDDTGKIDWIKVKNTPTINITSNAHTHDDRYYQKPDVDSRINSLNSAVNDLDGRVRSLFGILDDLDPFKDGSLVTKINFDVGAFDLNNIATAQWIGGSAQYDNGRFGFAAKSGGSRQIQLTNLPFDANTSVVTVSAWIKWNGLSSRMPFGFTSHDFYFAVGGAGFNTGNGDVYGVPWDEFKNTWKHIVVEFHKGEYGQIYIDGQLRTLTQINSSITVSNAKMDSTFTVFGWPNSTSYSDFGLVDQLSIFNRALTATEAQALYNGYIN